MSAIWLSLVLANNMIVGVTMPTPPHPPVLGMTLIIGTGYYCAALDSFWLIW